MAKVTITPQGKVIRGSDNRTEESDEQVEAKVMWDFKLKKTRIILVVSVVWFIFIYFAHSTDGFNRHMGYNATFESPYFYLWLIPIFVYWIVIPSYRWIMKGK